MMDMRTLKQTWTNPLTTGIFSKLEGLGNMPWSEDITSAILDTHYYLLRSGEKPVSPLINSLLIGDTLTDNDKVTLATVAKSHYIAKWNRLYELTKAEYNPIENYNMIETEEEEHSESTDSTTRDTGTTQNAETRNLSDTNSETVTHNTTESNAGSVVYGKTEGTIGSEQTSGSVNDTLTKNDTKTTTTSGSDDGETGIYGFNSQNAVDSTTNSTTTSGSSSEKDTGTDTKAETSSGSKSETITVTNGGRDDTTDTTTHTGTESKSIQETHTGTDTTTQTDNRTHTLDDDRAGGSERTLTRRGNIGVTTTAQMITGEIELWQWNFFESVMSDIDKLLTLSVYY